MIVGYLLDHVLAFILAIALLTAKTTSTSKLARVCRKCCKAFQDCSSFLCFSIEIAAIVVLVREDFGISTTGMGEDTVRMTQAVAMLVLLALLPPVLAAAYGSRAPAATSGESKSSLMQEDHPDPEENSSGNFSMVVICWALAFYPFYSKMNAAFGPSKITRPTNLDQQPILTPEQFQVVREICFGPIKQITVVEDGLMTAFVMLAYLPLSVFLVARIVWLGVKTNHQHSAAYSRLRTLPAKISLRRVQILVLATLLGTALTAIGLFWSIFRTQHSQKQLTASYGAEDDDGYWTFGQIVAVTVFAPVAAECWKSWKAEGVFEAP